MPALKDAPFVPRGARAPGAEAIFDAIRDAGLLRPPPVRLVRGRSSASSARRSTDPHVLAIKMTLYRIGAELAAGRRADRGARSGQAGGGAGRAEGALRRARTTSSWAHALEQAGVHVVYGVGGPEDALQARAGRPARRPTASRRYVHVGTGNYNAAPRSIYTDLGLFTADRADRRRRLRAVQLPDRLFRAGAATASCWSRRSTCAQRFAALDRARDRARAQQGRGRIIVKMNALVDPRDDPRALPRVAGRRARSI